jgi:glucokinase
MKMRESREYIGVDFGGTTITAGLVSGGEIRTVKTVPTRRERTPEEITQTIVGVVQEVSKGYTIKGVGIGVPCPSGPGMDSLVMVENLPNLEGYPLRALTEEQLGIPVILENDAKCMALGEYRSGTLRGCRNAACVTLGTGLGCGIIIDGAIYRGRNSYAGEIWNIPLPDGRVLEETVSIEGLKRLAREVMGDEIEPPTLHERFLAGDRTASETFDRYGEAVGWVMNILISTLDPERIALGGGLSKAFNAFEYGMRRVVERTWGDGDSRRIVPAALSDRAAVLGAAEAARVAFGLSG